MIDQKINNSLKELEQNLKDIDSARKQVETIVNSYNGLNNSTKEYISTLGSSTIKIKDLIIAITNDYKLKVFEMEKDRTNIVESANKASSKLSEASMSFKNSLDSINNKIKYCIIINALTIIALVIIFFFVVK